MLNILEKNKRFLIAVAIIFPASMIILGSFLEIYYYAFRFTQDGIELWLAMIIGISLTLLLNLAVFMRKLRLVWLLIIPLAIYSILCTSAGQSFSLGLEIKEEKIEQVQEEYTQIEIDETAKRITWIDEELVRIRKQKDETITSLSDRYHWKNTLKIAEELEAELTTERSGLTKKLSELRIKAKTKDNIEQRSTNTYEFYQGMTGWSAEWLQFALHTILSVFIAIMAPIGIIVITGMNVRTKRKRIPQNKTDKNTMDRIESLVEYWVKLNWMGLRTHNSLSILPAGIFYQFVKNRNEKYSQRNYETILNAAIKLGIIEQDGKIIEENERKAIDKIIGFLLTKKR